MMSPYHSYIHRGEIDRGAIFSYDAWDLDFYVADRRGQFAYVKIAVADDLGAAGLQLGDNGCHFGFKRCGCQRPGVCAEKFGDRIGN